MGALGAVEEVGWGASLVGRSFGFWGGEGRRGGERGEGGGGRKGGRTVLVFFGLLLRGVADGIGDLGGVAEAARVNAVDEAEDEGGGGGEEDVAGRGLVVVSGG